MKEITHVKIHLYKDKARLIAFNLTMIYSRNVRAIKVKCKEEYEQIILVFHISIFISLILHAELFLRQNTMDPRGSRDMYYKLY